MQNNFGVMSMFCFCFITSIVWIANAIKADGQCTDPKWDVRTCCQNQITYIPKYNGNFLAYVCDRNNNAELNPNGGWYCAQNTVDICCNMQNGYVAPISGGYQHSEPSDFDCKGLSAGQSDDGPLTSIAETTTSSSM